MAVYKNDANLQGLWLMENNLDDYTPNNNDLTNNGVTFSVDAKQGTYSGDFDSSQSDYGNITDAAQTGLAITGNISIVFWFKPASEDRTHYIVAKSGADGDEGYLVESNSTNNDIRCRLSANGTNQTTAYTPVDVISAGVWVHVAVVYNGTDIRIYIDGSLASNGANNPKAYVSGIFDTDVDFIIGCRSDRPGSFTDGLLDEVGVFDRALSATEVSDIYTYGIEDPSSSSSSSSSSSTSISSSSSSSSITSSSSSSSSNSSISSSSSSVSYSTSTSTSTSTSSTSSYSIPPVESPEEQVDFSGLTYIEQVAFTEPYQVQITGSDDMRLSIYLNQRGFSGT